MAMIQEFREFAVKGNALDMAVGIIIGGAFGKIVTSLVNDVVMPPLALLRGGVDLTALFVALGPGSFDTPDAAQAAGVATLNYGKFLQSTVDFLIIAFAVFLIVRAINTMRRKEETKPAAPPPTPEDVVLLREIRDALQR